MPKHTNVLNNKNMRAVQTEMDFPIITLVEAVEK